VLSELKRLIKHKTGFSQYLAVNFGSVLQSVISFNARPYQTNSVRRAIFSLKGFLLYSACSRNSRYQTRSLIPCACNVRFYPTGKIFVKLTLAKLRGSEAAPVSLLLLITRSGESMRKVKQFVSMSALNSLIRRIEELIVFIWRICRKRPKSLRI